MNRGMNMGVNMDKNEKSEKAKLDRQAKLALFYIGTAGCLLTACGMGVIFGWGWSMVTMGLAMILFFILGLIGFSLEE